MVVLDPSKSPAAISPGRETPSNSAHNAHNAHAAHNNAVSAAMAAAAANMLTNPSGSSVLNGMMGSSPFVGGVTGLGAGNQYLNPDYVSPMASEVRVVVQCSSLT